jgi:hypothetical protein
VLRREVGKIKERAKNILDTENNNKKFKAFMTLLPLFNSKKSFGVSLLRSTSVSLLLSLYFVLSLSLSLARSLAYFSQQSGSPYTFSNDLRVHTRLTLSSHVCVRALGLSTNLFILCRPKHKKNLFIA